MLFNRKSNAELTAKQVADRFMIQGGIYIFVVIVSSIVLILNSILTLLTGINHARNIEMILVMFLYLILMLIHRRTLYSRFVSVMLVYCDLPKFMEAFMRVAHNKLFEEDIRYIRSFYSVAYMYSADFKSAESVLKAEIDQSKKKWLKINAKANLASLYLMNGQKDEFYKLYNEIMMEYNFGKAPKYMERMRTGLEARWKIAEGDYDGAAEMIKKSIQQSERARSTFNCVTNYIQLGNIELARGNEMEAAVAYGYAIQHAPRMAYVQKYIPKYEELKSKFAQNAQAANA